MIDIIAFYRNPLSLNNCEHSTSEVRKRVFNMGAIQYVEQCLCCGEPISLAIKKETAYSKNNGIEPNAFDEVFYNESKDKRKVIFKRKVEDMIKANESEQEEKSKAIVSDCEKSKKLSDDEFYIKYNKYLSSSEWKSKRQEVMYRANGICEGCRKNRADQVHHLTYKHVFNEFLFELVALCMECHRRIHPNKTF